jgi:hypothetical protein
MNTDDKLTDAQEHAAASAPSATEPPWEEIEPGRFMPRRIRGSFRGRALG